MIKMGCLRGTYKVGSLRIHALRPSKVIIHVIALALHAKMQASAEESSQRIYSSDDNDLEVHMQKLYWLLAADVHICSHDVYTHQSWQKCWC